MKQKRFGQKVQNWHRPFQPSAFSQRYLRLRQQAEIVDYQYDGFDWDDWNDSQCWCDCCDPREEPYLDFRLNKLFSYITTPLNPLLNLHEMEIGQTEASGYAISPKPTETGSLEQRLAEHVKSFLGSWEDEAICRQITEYVGDRQNLSVLTRVAEINEIPGVVKLICFFAPFWVRQPMTWRQESGVSLLDHIFVLYDTPDFLFAEWRKQANAKVPDIKWLCWFILFAQGGSLKRAAALFNWNIADGFQHHLWKMPFGISAKEACLLAEVRRMGGNETDFWRICSYEPFAIDPTTFADQTNHAEAFWEERVTIDGNFWSQTVRWLIANRDEMEDESVILILSWAMHEYTETQRRQRRSRRGELIPPFSWKGRSFNATYERALEHRLRLERHVENYVWPNHGWDWAFEEPDFGKWSFVELTSSEELRAESGTMKHCVSTYGNDCVSGKSAIFSVKRNDKRCLTIEINPRNKQAVQIRGACNRLPFREEQRAVNLWLNTAVRPKIADSAEQSD